MTDLLTPPLDLTASLDSITVTVHGVPAPQGSKRHVGGGVMIESSKKVKPWRQDVKDAALTATAARPGWTPLDGPLAATIVFTVREQPASKPTWWTAGLPWSKGLRWRPASTPDLSKLLRSTEDALTGIVWRDDARVVDYARLAKYYAGDPAADVLPFGSGAVIRVWRVS
ncbi:RusA family crossover junction endodeoxyribonuclease [Kitasatospora sp. NPDC057223]|uniref:RusA family crossover junction endodeoxyribonuclease n=1 Tax=Kitasatospora sp. NPDC057223 TaxID=3346055 RepID=UPI00362CA44A